MHLKTPQRFSSTFSSYSKMGKPCCPRWSDEFCLFSLFDHFDLVFNQINEWDHSWIPFGHDGVLSYLFEISDNKLFLAHYLLPPTSAWCFIFSLQPTYYVFLWASGNLLLTNLPWVVCVLKSERSGKILLKIQHLQLLVEGVEKWEVEKTFGKKNHLPCLNSRIWFGGSARRE